jgi:phage terminase large subunit
MPNTLKLPKKTEHAVRWLIATLEGKTGPGTDYPVPLRHLLFKGGRGSAKSHTVGRIVINVVKALGVRALCTRETMKSIEESVYTLLSDCITELGYDDDFDKKKTTLDCKNGGNMIFAGLRQQDVAKLKSTEKIQLAWCEEAHVLSEHSLEVLTPTIREENSVIIYSYNPELDDDPVHARFALDPQPDVCVVTLNWRDNPWFPRVLERERQRTYDRDKTDGKYKYNWIWEGHTLPAVEGAIFANEVAKLHEQGRIIPLEYDPKGQVHVVMDLGYGVMTAMLVQKFASTVQVIGYYEMYHSTYHDLTQVLEKLDYRWGKVFMPHDAAHRDPKYGKSHKEVMQELGWKVAAVEQVGIENYVEMGRGLFSNIYISNNDDTAHGGCAQLLRCLKRWRYQITETDTGSKKMMAPMKDEFSHGGETFCYVAVCADQMVNDQIRTDPYKALRAGGYAG